MVLTQSVSRSTEVGSGLTRGGYPAKSNACPLPCGQACVKRFRGYLASVRVVLSGIVLALAFSAFAQKPSGEYHPAKGQPVTWSINAARTLVWGGAPYLPVGIRVDGTPASILAAKEAKIQDVIVELPAGGTNWDEALKALEDNKMRYLIDVSSLAPMAKGYAVEPQGYSIAGITQPRKIEANIPGATSVLTLLITKRDNNVEKVQRIALENGRLSTDVRPLNDLEHILLIYPEMRSLEQPDLWESLDEHRDTLITSLKKHAPGPGLRGIVNPLGRMMTLARNDARFVPSSPYFRYEFRTYLEKKYRNIEVAQRAWSLSSNELKSFDEMARLVPLWAGNRGVSQLWDPTNDKMVLCDQKRSSIWKDLREVITAAGARRYQRLTASIREQADVPVVQEWSGWAAAYEGENVSVDGIGARVSGQSPTQQIESASRAASTVLRWKAPGWLLATDIDAHDDTQVGGLVDDLAVLGMRGWFFRPGAEKGLAEIATQKAGDVSLSADGSSAIFFPENALNPATAQRLPGGKWWLPSPTAGNRVDLGTQFYGYRSSDGANSYFAIWAVSGTQRVKLRTTKAKNLSFMTVDGSDSKPKFVKGGVEVTIGQFPLLVFGTDDIPVPEPAYQETIARFGFLVKKAEERKLDVLEERYGFADALGGFDVNPGGSYASMRQWFWRLSNRFAPYSWIEAEFSKDNNFSEPLSQLGCSNSYCLSLKSSLESFAQSYYADYSVPTRSLEELEVWVAARISPQARPFLSVNVGGQTLTIQSEGISPYGAGFAWYKLGTTKLAQGVTKIRLSVDAPQGTDLAIDTLLLFPGSFRPNGVYFPDAVDFSQVRPKG